LGIGSQVAGQDFDRNLALQPRVAGVIDLAHAARAEDSRLGS